MKPLPVQDMSVVNSYTSITNQMGCYATEFFPKAITCLTGFNLQRHLNE